jgi:hypothetical protein
MYSLALHCLVIPVLSLYGNPIACEAVCDVMVLHTATTRDGGGGGGCARYGAILTNPTHGGEDV